MITLKMHFLNYKFNDKIIANGVIWYYTKYIEVAGPKKPSAESQWFDARDRANKNVKAEKRSVPLHSCTGLRQKPEMRRWRGNHKEGIVIRPLEPVYSKILEGPLSMKVINNDYLLKQK